MAKKREVLARKLAAHSNEEKLDEINAEVLNRADAPDGIRHAMEAQIESKARRRRRREPSASSGWKSAG
jgi:hypothetical protein